MTAPADFLPAMPFARPHPLEPPEELARLRATAPVVRVRAATGKAAWLVTRYDEARAVLADRRFGLALPGLDSAETGETGSLFQNPPGHTRLRRLVSTAFTPRRVEALRARTLEIAEGLLDVMLDRQRPVDLMEAFAFPLPITVIGELLGVPAADREHFRTWSDALLSLADSGGGSDPGAAWADLSGQVSDLIARKRERPGDDLLSALIAVRDDDADRLSDAELVMMAITLIPAGYVTTATTLASALILLTQHQVFERLAAEPALIPRAVDEVLRYQAAAGDVARVAVEDVQLADVTIRAGDKALISLTSANRDERLFTEPDRFDITRNDNAHLSFGHGIHHCLGAALARLELQVALTVLASRLPTLNPAMPLDELTWQRSDLFGDEYLTTLPVSW